MLALNLKSVQAHPEENVEIFPTDDCHVAEGHPNQVLDSGTKYNMYIGWDEQEYLSERIYLKFDLSGISADSIENAFLRIYNKFSPSIGEEPYTSKVITVDAKEVEDDDWDETTITWNNKPAIGNVLDTLTINRGFGDPGLDPRLWEWWSFDVTSYVASEFAGDKIVSIGLMSQNEGTDDACVWFYSKDALEHQPLPHLKISYSTAAEPGDGGAPSAFPTIYVIAAVVIIAVIVGAVLAAKRL